MMQARNELMPNYGWVQNTSNLSTIRDTIELVPNEGLTHSQMRTAIKDFRMKKGDLPTRWEWDARCRIKAIHACGLVTLNRIVKGYDLTAVGKQLKEAPKSDEWFRGHRRLTQEEIKLFKKGLLTNPPVIRVLELLNNDRKGEKQGLSKYDIGKELGFFGDIGFTHLDPYWVARNGYSFNNKEGDADKWARTILSWIEQVGWVYKLRDLDIQGQSLPLYSAIPEIENVLRYDASRIRREVPAEMLCSNHHAFPKLVQKRRSAILSAISSSATTKSELVQKLRDQDIQSDEANCEFELKNLTFAGFRITENGGYYKLDDKIKLDVPVIKVPPSDKPSELDELIEKSVLEYGDDIPQKYIDHLIRFGYTNDNPVKFEAIVGEYLRHIGYEVEPLGQGRGRVADILAKYIDSATYRKSYGLIIDAKASQSTYNFPAGDKRKMKEYIKKHGPILSSQIITNHAFSFISSAFHSNAPRHLDEIAADTSVSGCAITILVLLELGKRLRNQKLKIEGIYDLFTTNNLLALPESTKNPASPV